MSNTAVGSIYEKIINETISTSKLDFAEDGVPETVLNELLEKWQSRLSGNRVAQFPWDPTPPAATSIPTVPSNVKTSEPSHSYQSPAAPSPAQTAPPAPISNIKQEPTYETNNAYVPQLPQNNGYPNSGSNPQLAQQRAQALMQERYGAQAGSSIAAMQAAGMGIPTQQRPQGVQLPGQQIQQQPKVQQPPPPQQNNAVKLAQTDGAGDSEEQWNAVLENRHAEPDDGPAGRHAVDGMIRRHVQEMAMRLEGGGLLETLEERERRFGRRRKFDSSAKPSSSNSKAPARYDGGDDIEDEKPLQDDDDDAINSELDDPEDTGDGEEEIDTEMGDYILCTYDKVQRVKNKWKCTLKDGVLHADGKDYVFHKAQGEFEW